MFSKIASCSLVKSIKNNHLSFRNNFLKHNFAFQKKPLKYKMKTQNHAENLNKKSKEYTNLQIGLYGFIFACCFAAIPLYRVFCEHVGLVGNYDKKTYQFKDKQIINVKKFAVKFEGLSQPGVNWEFQPIEKQVIVGASQTAIVFYRLRNKQNRSIVGFSTYNIYPQEANLYFSKIQCFCFNQQMINPEEELLLPLFFYLEPEINEDPDVSRINQIKVNYQFYQSSNQDLAKFAEQQMKRVEQNKRKLNQIRAKKSNMSIQQYENHLEQQEDRQRREVAELQITTTDPSLESLRKKQRIKDQNTIQSQKVSRNFE